MQVELWNMLLRLITKDKKLIDGCNIFEIRIRAGGKIRVYTAMGERFLDERGHVTFEEKSAYAANLSDIEEILEYICKSSLYAFEEEIKNGFITINGGNRIGIAGQVVIDQNGQIKTIKNISSLNVRIANEVMGISDLVLKHLYEGEHVINTLIVAPPGCGKTTLLRDLVRQISNGNKYSKGKNVAVIDERSEIAASYMGKPSCDIGSRTDILDACPKDNGIIMAIRSLSPEVIAVDELGEKRDFDAVLFAMARGASFVATMHGADFGAIEHNLSMGLRNSFGRYIILGKVNGKPSIKGIYKDNGECIEDYRDFVNYDGVCRVGGVVQGKFAI